MPAICKRACLREFVVSPTAVSCRVFNHVFPVPRKPRLDSTARVPTSGTGKNLRRLVDLLSAMVQVRTVWYFIGVSLTPRRNSALHPLDRSVVHRLLRLVNLISRPFFTQHGRRYDLSLQEWRLMMLLANRPGLSSSEICDLTGMHLMNVSRGVRRLARLGRVERTIDPADRRRIALALTPKGLALYRRIAPAAWQREKIMHSALTRDELVEFCRLLDKLLAGFLAQRDNSRA